MPKRRDRSCRLGIYYFYTSDMDLRCRWNCLQRMVVYRRHCRSSTAVEKI